MNLLISQADLSDYTRLSVNIAPLLINPAIRDAHTFDVLPQLRADEETALSAYYALTPTQKEEYILAGEASEDPDVVAFWRRHRLYAAVRPLLCYHTYRRFLLDHGAHITANGVETISEVGHMPISGQQRAEMRADASAKCAHYQALLVAALQVYRGPVGRPACASSTRRPRSGGLTMTAI
ncbi:hypothetical protein GCM10023185_31010 [Hymenobacter saemangeumensis]|uniref:Uncharacterized protein n=1 Tax=Hymenobacter saemangeumensis TaxID=1084522 RepID=A0ABP8ILW2_9BACT